MSEEVTIKTVVHGIYWIMNKKEKPMCPECSGIEHFIEVSRSHEGGNVVPLHPVVVAQCTCHHCGCKFEVSKKE